MELFITVNSAATATTYYHYYYYYYYYGVILYLIKYSFLLRGWEYADCVTYTFYLPFLLGQMSFNTLKFCQDNFF